MSGDNASAAPGGSAETIAPWPKELRVRKEDRLFEIEFETGESFSFTAEMLRVLSPSAEVKGHGPGQEVTVGGKRNVGFAEVTPVGNYAVRITFDDGHNTGFYSWNYLYDLGNNKDARWADYLRELELKGLSRG